MICNNNELSYVLYEEGAVTIIVNYFILYAICSIGDNDTLLTHCIALILTESIDFMW